MSDPKRAAPDADPLGIDAEEMRRIGYPPGAAGVLVSGSATDRVLQEDWYGTAIDDLLLPAGSAAQLVVANVAIVASPVRGARRGAFRGAI